MGIEELSNAELAALHREKLLKARIAREDGDLDLAQSYLAFVRPLNAEMLRRMARAA